MLEIIVPVFDGNLSAICIWYLVSLNLAVQRLLEPTLGTNPFWEFRFHGLWAPAVSSGQGNQVSAKVIVRNKCETPFDSSFTLREVFLLPFRYSIRGYGFHRLDLKKSFYRHAQSTWYLRESVKVQENSTPSRTPKSQLPVVICDLVICASPLSPEFIRHVGSCLRISLLFQKIVSIFTPWSIYPTYRLLMNVHKRVKVTE